MLFCRVSVPLLPRLPGLAHDDCKLPVGPFAVNSCVALATEPATCPGLRASELKNGSLRSTVLIGWQHRQAQSNDELSS